MKYGKFVACCLALIVIAGAGCERKVTNQVTTVAPAAQRGAYIGSSACEACHSDIYATFKNTGHPHMVNQSDSVQQAGHYPDFVTALQKPGDLAWASIDRVIGGFWWKANFTDAETGGIFKGPDRTFYLGDAALHDYDGSTAGLEAYTCGACHTTGYQAEGHQNGKDSIAGTWAFDGVQCERCHGPGQFHASRPYDNPMTIDRSSALCGECHYKGDLSTISAGSGFIKDHQQYNEMYNSKHNALQCVDCHNMHVSLHPNNPGRSSAMTNKCENCHLEETQSFAASDLPHYNNGVACTECHMPLAVKSALATGTYEADVHTHTVVINTSATASMFSADSSKANPYLTVEYTCLKSGCHDPSVSGNTKAWAAANAARVHAPAISDVTTCFTCHSDQNFALTAAEQQYEMSKHGTGETFNENRNNDPSDQTCEQCHTNEGFVAKVTSVPAVGNEFTRINCFTCHQPHTSGTLELRVQRAATLANGYSFDRGNANTCASCHQSRRKASTYVVNNVTLSNRFGPHHGPQADMLMGTNAYEYSGYTYDKSAHTNSATRACLDCHMTNSLYATGGHTFNVADEENDYDNMKGCNVKACHNGAITTFDRTASADFDGDGTINGVQTEIEGLRDTLAALLQDANLIDSTLTPVARTVATADSTGALYNYLFVGEDRSGGVHNTKYAVGLLRSAINFLETGDPSGESRRSSRIAPIAAH